MTHFEPAKLKSNPDSVLKTHTCSNVSKGGREGSGEWGKGKGGSIDIKTRITSNGIRFFHSTKTSSLTSSNGNKMVRVRGYVLLHQSKKWYDWEGGEYYTLLPKYKTLLFSHTSKRKGREGKGKKSTDPSPLQLLAKRLPRERGRGRGKMERGRASLILPSIIPLSSSAACEAIAKGREGKGGKGREMYLKDIAIENAKSSKFL